PISDWSYDTAFPKPFGGMTGAVLNEELRLIPPALHIPKTTGSSPQSLMINGKEVVIPANVHISLNCIAAHRNPSFWPTMGPPKRAGKLNDLDDFVPERWLVDSSKSASLENMSQERTHGK